MTEADRIERIRAALWKVSGKPVSVMPRSEFEDSLRPGGKPTRLDAPYSPYAGIQGNPNFRFAAASGVPHTHEPAWHHVRYDPKDGQNSTNVDSFDAIDDLPTHEHWAEALRLCGETDTEELRSLARRHVFGFRTYRDDHQWPNVPDDIDGAKPLDEDE